MPTDATHFLVFFGIAQKTSVPCARMATHTALAPTLTSCQETALDMLTRQGNVFLTGAAGTGKSFLLHRYVHDKPTDAFPIVASTGAAAVLIGGRTFHSFFGLGIMEGGIDETVRRAVRSKRLVHRLLSACCVVIDEVSMLSGTTLDAAERIARCVRNRNEPWGGLRIIAVGDFAQLPPVAPGSSEKDWAFAHAVWQNSAFAPALLSTVMRTSDRDFLDILNSVRSGDVTENVRSFLDGRTDLATEETEGTRLYAHRNSADAYNHRRLDAIPRTLYSFETRYAGEARMLETAKRAMPIPDVLHLKEGALVMMRKNDVSEPQLYVNGSLGHVRRIDDDTLTIELFSGDAIDVEPQKFSYVDGDGKELLAAWNFPVTLAWATTIHKAQGTSLDSLIVDLSALWEPGQAYVALSRVRHPERLFIERWHSSSIRAEPLVTQLYDSFAKEMASYVPRPPFVFHRNTDARETAKQSRSHGVRSSHTKQKRASLIREMLAECAPLETIAAKAHIKVDRVLLYIEESIEQGVPVSIRYLLDEVPDVSRIRTAFEEHGLQRLRPAYDALHEAVPFTTLRLVRCVMLAEAQA